MSLRLAENAGLSSETCFDAEVASEPAVSLAEL
jgi:hypothetical protein